MLIMPSAERRTLAATGRTAPQREYKPKEELLKKENPETKFSEFPDCRHAT